MKKYAIGIPTLNRLDLLYPAMLYYEIDFPNTKKFIVDNGNQDLGWNLDKVSATIIENEKNIGVAASWNQLCRQIFKEHEYAIILNDDIYLGRQDWCIDSFFTWLDMQTLENKPLSRADFFVGPRDWCAFIIPKKTFEDVGDFDERFFPAYYEDNDYAMRMKLMGKKIEILPFLDPALFRSSETIKKDSGIKAEESKKNYIQKWGGIPGEEMKSGIVMKDKGNTVIAFNSNCGGEFNPEKDLFGPEYDYASIFNEGMIIQAIGSEKIIDNFKNGVYEHFHINKIHEYLNCDRLLVVSQGEIIIDAKS